MATKVKKQSGPRETRVRAENLQIGDTLLINGCPEREVADVDYTSSRMCNVAVRTISPVPPMHFKSDEKVRIRRNS